MVAPHFHTVEEAKKAINNTEGGSSDGPPKPKSGGSGRNLNSGTTEKVPPHTKGAPKGKSPDTI